MAPPVSAAVARPLPKTAPVASKAAAKAAPPPPPAKQTVTDWFGDRYMKVDISTKDGKSVPTRISLPGGDATVKLAKDGNYEIQYKGKTYIAEPLRGSGGAFNFYEKLPMGTGQNGDVSLPGREGMFRPQHLQLPFMRPFGEAVALANGGVEAKQSPADLKKAADAAAVAAIAPTRAAANAVKVQLGEQRQQVQTAAESLNKTVAPLLPLIQKGLVTITKDEDGLTQVKMQLPEGMSAKERTRLEKRFGPLVEMLQMDINKAEGIQTATASQREHSAQVLYQKLNSPAMQKYFESLPQPQRMQEFNQYASLLQGTQAGDKLANDLFGERGVRTDIEPKGALKVSTDLGRTVLKGVYDSQDSRAALSGLTLALAPNIKNEYINGDDGKPAELPFWRRERIAEINFGRPLTDNEKKVLDVAAQGPEKIAELMTPEGAAKHGLPLGLASETLAKLGGMPTEIAHSAHDVKAVHDAIESAVHAEKAGIGAAHHALNDSKLAPLAKGVMIGATVLSAIDATSAVSHFLEHPGLETGAHAAEGVARTLHIAGETMHTFGASNWLTASAKATGVAAGTLALAIDIAKDAESPEAKDSKVMNIIGDVAIIGGTIAGGPLGLGLAIVGTGYKWLAGGPSESYDKAYGEYEKALKE